MRRWVQQRPVIPRAGVVHPGTRQVGMQAWLQNHSGGRARDGTLIDFPHPRHCTTFMD